MNFLLRVTPLVLIVLALSSLIPSSEGGVAEWNSFKTTFNKQYPSSTHEAKARANFEKRLSAVKAQNLKYYNGESSWRAGINDFSDLSDEDFQKGKLGYKPQPSIGRRSLPSPQDHYRARRQSTPTSLDYRAQGKVSAIENQYQCGCCWSFSAMGSIESQMLMKGWNEEALSEEQLVDCYAQNCDGNTQAGAWQWLQQNGGADTSADYPFTASNANSGSGQCQAGQCKNFTPVVKVTGYQSLPMPTTDDAMMSYLAANGPLAITIDGSQNAFQSYSGGIMQCSGQINIDHAIMLVGYSTGGGGSGGNGTGDYWIIKNSWGTSWGEQGFAQVAMGNPQDCGITQGQGGYTGYPQISQ